MLPSEVLIAARARIDRPEKWGKGNKSSTPPPGTPCAVLAIYHGTWSHADGREARRIFGVANGLEVRGSAADWNDAPERTHAEVLAAFDKAIALAQRDEAARGGEGGGDAHA